MIYLLSLLFLFKFMGTVIICVGFISVVKSFLKTDDTVNERETNLIAGITWILFGAFVLTLGFSPITI